MLQSYVLFDHLSQLLQESKPMLEELLGEDVCIVKDCEWCLAFDGSSIGQGGGVSTDGSDLSLSFNLDFLGPMMN